MGIASLHLCGGYAEGNANHLPSKNVFITPANLRASALEAREFFPGQQANGLTFCILYHQWWLNHHDSSGWEGGNASNSMGFMDHSLLVSKLMFRLITWFMDPFLVANIAQLFTIAVSFNIISPSFSPLSYVVVTIITMACFASGPIFTHLASGRDSGQWTALHFGTSSLWLTVCSCPNLLPS